MEDSDDLHAKLKSFEAKYRYLCLHPIQPDTPIRLMKLAAAIKEVKAQIAESSLDWRTCGF